MSLKNKISSVRPNLQNILFIILFAVLLTSCGDEAGRFGLEILPDDDKVEAFYTDTFDLTLETVPIGAIPSVNGRYGFAGGYHDPIFGYTEAAFTAQFLPLSLKIDSIKPIVD